MNVLFVDDEAGFLDIIIKRFRKRHIDASGVPDGEQALERIAEGNFDVVVLDVQMPGSKNGIKVLEEIKSRWPLIEVIMLTGHAMLDAARAGMDNGAFDYIVKPVDFDELYYKITDAYKKKSLQEAKLKGIT
ncbi:MULTISPECIES: response regulator [Desulfobacter]|jgi:DNA-binding NtrC family response regulator|uniref:response regulator n=1 Tax=Desulfobacter TaxID=2289 RepID=UPI000E9E4F08|nr:MULTISPECIES: response regulator [Desulfobacter]MBP8829820.1 response regulator [Desulfobacter sp.]MDX9965156.1 response regulator [Desulfobacter postgatei]HAR34141.1 two-component system response regulator [Desulfobacter sp.]HBT87263.1 two-component system response regulator [Desulfobacter sp.]